MGLNYQNIFISIDGFLMPHYSTRRKVMLVLEKEIIRRTTVVLEVTLRITFLGSNGEER